MRPALPALLAALAFSACSPPATESPPAEPAASGVTIVVTTPLSGARVTSPVRVEGTAPGDWFFESMFPVELRDANGVLIAQGPAQAQSDWMTEAPVPYVAQLTFSVATETQATLVLKEDMPSGLPGQREISIPVVLEPN